MPHPANQLAPITSVAEALGLQVIGRHARCYNAGEHHKQSDARPSLALFDDTGRFHCFACGVQGDAIDLVRAIRSCSFSDAVDWLESTARRESLPPRSAGTNGETRRRQPDERDFEVYARLYASCCEVLPGTPAGRYLSGRGIDLAVANDYHAAEVDDPGEVWGRLTSDFAVENLARAGLVSRAGKFLFAGHRLLFFYCEDGWPLYVQGRDVTGTSRAKELSLAGLSSPVPFNVDLIRERQQRVYLCEGCVDTLSALQLQIPAVGIPGVTGFHAAWFEYFAAVDHVVVLFDNDEAGRRQAAELRMQFRLRGIKADAEFPPPGQDINDLLFQSLEREPHV